MPNLIFDKTTRFLGRNGTFKMTGMDLYLSTHSKTVSISPITSKGDVGRCDMEIPVENIDAVCEQLQTLKRQAS